MSTYGIGTAGAVRGREKRKAARRNIRQKRALRSFTKRYSGSRAATGMGRTSR